MAQSTFYPSADAYMHDAYPDDEFGGGVGVAVGCLVADEKLQTYRGLFRFDISAIPAGSTILSTSKLRLYCRDHGLGGATSYAGTAWHTQKSWVEAQVTWNDYITATAWTAAGGDYAAPDFDMTIAGTLNTWQEWTGADLASWLQDMLDDESGIADMLVRRDGEDESGYKTYCSKDDNHDPAHVPELVIDYTPPVGVRRVFLT